ncbi:MAG: serine/threonine protein kinase [Chloroflexi bacterium]|nr:serine/threonine protein kinase [Chloroflexota bacterium]MBU1747376.1 serine/threonine protein kinase [Chloroflexota bacterium]
MNQILKPGQTVQTEAGVPCKVDKFLGGGGQGEVYRAKLGDKDVVALKWYFPAQATPRQRTALETLIKKGAPTTKFLWPLTLTRSPDVPGFGYIMPLREPRFKGIVDLMKRRIEPSFRALTTAGLTLADSYLALHSQGLCYRDISFGNVFFDPDTGEALICDNDNVAVDKEGESGVLGTPRFMAPEIVRGEAKPGTESDLFSLAVLLFYMLMVHHPLEGKRELAIKCLDLPAMNKLYGTEPLFIFDPNDDSNRPVPGVHDNAIAFWPLYPQFLRDLFTEAFTAGLQDPHERIRESEWRGAMVRLRDSIVYCAQCGMENFYDPDALKAGGGQPGPCWSCGAPIQLPPRIRIGDQIIMLNHDTQLFPHHVDDQRMYDFSQPVVEVIRHPKDPSVWGLKNLSNEKWVIIGADGAQKDVEPGRSATLAVGVKINFGRKEGEIRV